MYQLSPLSGGLIVDLRCGSVGDFIGDNIDTTVSSDGNDLYLLVQPS